MYLTTFIGLVTIASLVKLCITYMPNAPIGSYKSPWVPFLPCLGILGNFVLCSRIGLFSWIAFLFYLGIGLAFYLGYGQRYSKLNNSSIC